MSTKKHVVNLSYEERKTLLWFVSASERKTRDIDRAKILLKADDGLTDEQISEHVDCSIETPYNVRKRTVTEDSM